MPLDLDKSGRFPQVHKTYLGPSLGWIYTDEPTYVEFIIGAGVVISTGLKGYLTIKEWCIIQSWIVLSSVSGSIEIDIWKTSMDDFLAGNPPTPANSICSLAPPTLASQAAASSDALSGWNTLLNQNDVLAFNVNSCTGISRCSLILRCVRSLGEF